MTAFRFKIEGDKRARDAMLYVAEQLHGREMVDAMTRATLVVERAAKKNAPVDTGRLRSSITHAVRTTGLINPTIQGIVGTNVKYAPYMEYGTGTFAGKSPYFPPPSALEGWARRHGMNAYLVALAIFENGGLEPRHYFKDALEETERQVSQILQTTVRTIIRNS